MENRSLNLNFYGDTAGLMKGASHLQQDYGFNICDTGIPVKVTLNTNNISVLINKDTIEIRCPEKIHFYRALGLAIENYSGKKDFFSEEKVHFDLVGIFLDCSRNSVPTVDSIKRIIHRMAVMGITTIVLYLEDTYEVPGTPYFGYMRGRYTTAELKEIDDYADLFGIELMPCIQTLGHMEHVLKWDFASDIRDTGEILLAGEEKTYDLLDKMIGAVSTPLRSRRLCIGMDEA